MEGEETEEAMEDSREGRKADSVQRAVNMV